MDGDIMTKLRDGRQEKSWFDFRLERPRAPTASY